MKARTPKSRTSRAIAALIASMLVITAGALAYWSATGSGEGEYAKAKASTTNFEVTNVEGAELYPGGTAEPKAKIKNVETSGTEHIKKLTAEVKSVSNSGTLVEAETGSKCFVGWFEVKKVNGAAGTSAEPNENVEHGTAKEYPVEVLMKEEATKNQNGCKGAKVTLKYSVE
ncbi:MAG TPA: hypothetical protein VMA83_10985 [Solirubrobacteraceae bacterium]|nr:hypothetical protein [Solirubrobacteraceae bacterium]